MWKDITKGKQTADHLQKKLPWVAAGISCGGCKSGFSRQQTNEALGLKAAPEKIKKLGI